MRNALMASACDTALLASSIADWTAARRSSSSTRSATLASALLPLFFFQSGHASSSIVTRQAMNGFWSPTTMHWLISGWARSRSSSTAGAAVFPPPLPVSFLFPAGVRGGGGGFFPPRGDDEFLLAAGDAEVAVRVELADVTGVEPAVALERLLGGLRVVEVAGEHVVALQQDFAVVGDADGHTRDRSADGADLQRVRTVAGCAGRGLGEAVALVDRHADAAIEVTEPSPERRTAGDRRLHPAPERCTKLGVDKRVEETVRRLQREALKRVAVERLAVGDRDPLGEVEDRPLAVGVRLLLRLVVDLLEHSRHRQDERRLERREVGQQVLDVRGVTHPDPVLHATDLDDPCEHVRQRQEQQGGLVGSE